MNERRKKGHMLVMGFDLSIIKFLQKSKNLLCVACACVVRNSLSMYALARSYMRPCLDASYGDSDLHDGDNGSTHGRSNLDARHATLEEENSRFEGRKLLIQMCR